MGEKLSKRVLQWCIDHDAVGEEVKVRAMTRPGISVEVAALEAKLEAMGEYISLLEAEGQELAPLAFVHGWTSSRAEEGKRLRALIAAAPEEPRE